MAIGDAMLDIVAVPESGSADLEYMEVSMSFQVGGSGVHLALAAASMGFAPVSLVCSLGADEDIANRNIETRLQAADVSLITNPASGYFTGITIIGYLTNESRILLTAPGANRAPLEDAVVTVACAALPGIVVVSGYMLFRTSTRNGTLEIMRQAARRGSVVVLDLVPHSVHTTITLAELRSLLHGVNFVAGALSTFAGFGTDIEDLLPEVEFVLGYRPDRTYKFVRRSGSRIEGEFQDPSHSAAPRGMSERLLIWILKSYFLS